MSEPRDGGFVVDRDGDAWASTPEGLWACMNRASSVMLWADLLAEFGPLDVFVYRGTEQPTGFVYSGTEVAP